MLDMALAACRDPEPGDVGEALETIGAALSAAASCSASEDGVRAGDRPRLPLDRARRDRAPGPRAEPRRGGACAQASRRAARSASTAAHSPLSRRSRSRMPEALARTRRRPRRPPRASSPAAISCAGAPGSIARRARAAAGAAGSRARRPARRAPSGRAEPRQRARARRSKRRTSIATPLTAAFARAACDALALVVEREHRREAELRGGDREHPRAGADVEQRRRASRSRPASSSSSSRHRRVRGVRAGAERLPGVDHDLAHAAVAARARRLPRRPHVQRGQPRGAPARGARRRDQHRAVEAASSAPASRRRSRSWRSRPAHRRRAARRSGRLGQLARRAVDGVLDRARRRARPPRRPRARAPAARPARARPARARTRTARRITRPGCRSARRSLANIDSCERRFSSVRLSLQLLASARAARR